MKITLIMLLVAGSFLWSLYKRFKRTVAETAGDSMSEEQPYDEQDAVSEEPASASSPYFSYEYEMSPAPKNGATSRPQQAHAAKPQPVTVAERPMAFDLRQAVIYQTVLNNPYIDEIN